MVSEKTGARLSFHNCDKFASQYTTCKGIKLDTTGQGQEREIEKDFLKMSLVLVKDTKGKFVFILTFGKNKGVVDRLIPGNETEAIAFNNLIAQIGVDQRRQCRNCNPLFTSCLVLETLKAHRKNVTKS